ncbi:MAG: sigma-70 family RNA polymerase sigma factor [Ruminococcus sp.]|nr:sigma-70 family RNA polymerase sigma factor [Ruminococcus sp.]
MSRNVLYAEDFLCDRASYLAYTSSGDTNRDELRKMKSILKRAMYTELTDLQRFCLVEHYLHGRKMKDIASELSLHPSTITRHISNAEKKLRHIASYYQ